MSTEPPGRPADDPKVLTAMANRTLDLDDAEGLRDAADRSRRVAGTARDVAPANGRAAGLLLDLAEHSEAAAVAADTIADLVESETRAPSASEEGESPRQEYEAALSAVRGVLQGSTLSQPDIEALSAAVLVLQRCMPYVPVTAVAKVAEPGEDS
jgi:hypothetical protein